jgi:hypothetical protein
MMITELQWCDVGTELLIFSVHVDGELLNCNM